MGNRTISKSGKSMVGHCRGVACQLAVNCRSTLDRIESIEHWEEFSELEKWHQFFLDAKKMFLEEVPKKPAAAPPNPFIGTCGLSEGDVFVGSGDETGQESVGVAGPAPSTQRTSPTTSWDEVIGNK